MDISKSRKAAGCDLKAILLQTQAGFHWSVSFFVFFTIIFSCPLSGCSLHRLLQISTPGARIGYTLYKHRNPTRCWESGKAKHIHHRAPVLAGLSAGSQLRPVFVQLGLRSSTHWRKPSSVGGNGPHLLIMSLQTQLIFLLLENKKDVLINVYLLLNVELQKLTAEKQKV